MPQQKKKLNPVFRRTKDINSMVRELMLVNMQVAQSTTDIAAICPKFLPELKQMVDQIAEEVKNVALWLKAVQTGQVKV